MTRRKYAKSDGYKVEDLLNYAIDHLLAARHLFTGGPAYYDSAGYLAHLGLELFLKAFHLHEHGFFTDTHSLQSIYEGIRKQNPAIALGAVHLATMKMVDEFNVLRYPTPRYPVDIGDEDWDRIVVLVTELSRKLPKECTAELNFLVMARKGGRVLMKRKQNRS